MVHGGICSLEAASRDILFSNPSLSLCLFIGELRLLMLKVAVKQYVLIPVILL